MNNGDEAEKSESKAPSVITDGRGGSITILEEGSATTPMRYRMVLPQVLPAKTPAASWLRRHIRSPDREIQVHMLIMADPHRVAGQYTLDSTEPAAGRRSQQLRDELRRDDDRAQLQAVPRTLLGDRREQLRQGLKLDVQLAEPALRVKLPAVAEGVPRPGRQLGRASLGIVDRHEDIDAQAILVGAMHADRSAAAQPRLSELQGPPRCAGRDLGECSEQGVPYRPMHILPAERRAKIRVRDVSASRWRDHMAIAQPAVRRRTFTSGASVIIDGHAYPGDRVRQEDHDKGSQRDRKDLPGAFHLHLSIVNIFAQHHLPTFVHARPADLPTLAEVLECGQSESAPTSAVAGSHDCERLPYRQSEAQRVGRGRDHSLQLERCLALAAPYPAL